MIQYDLIGALKTYATANSMVFLYGDNFFQNYEATQHEYFNGQKILTAEFTCRPLFGKGNKVGQITYNGILALGQKFDNDGTPAVVDDPLTIGVDESQVFNDGTSASLDETKYQKYTRRLLSLMQSLSTIISQFACTNQLEINNVNMKMDINKHDENIDFVACEITFIQ